ncbi:unnamed protein product, partial [marine sediment metagenome]
GARPLMADLRNMLEVVACIGILLVIALMIMEMMR